MDVKATPVVQTVFSISLRKLALITVALPFVGFVFCIAYSYHYHFQRTTQTHCNVWNFAPSISSAISVSNLPKYVWKSCIALHSAPRLLFALLYKNYCKAGLRGRFKRLLASTIIANLLENFGLIYLSFATSREDYTGHKLGFIIFVSCSTFYLCSSFVIFNHLWWAVRTESEERGLAFKKVIVITYLVTTVMALYFYSRHNKYCEPGVYSIFSICEYLIVILNMCYHSTAYFDFHDKFLTV